MQTTITSYCWNCETELYKEFGGYDFCGTTHIECSNCGTLNITGNKPYSKMNFKDVIFEIFDLFIFDIIFILTGGLLTILLFVTDYNKSIKEKLIIGGIFILYNSFKFIKLQKLILDVEIQQKKINQKLRKNDLG